MLKYSRRQMLKSVSASLPILRLGERLEAPAMAQKRTTAGCSIHAAGIALRQRRIGRSD